MSTSTTTGNENMPLYLGLAVVAIILIAFFSKGEEAAAPSKKKKVAATTAATASPKSTTTSKKSKKKKSGSKAKAAAPPAEKKVVVQEEALPSPVVPEPETKTTATKKKKKKSKKKSKAAAAEPVPQSTTTDEPKLVASADADSDDESDDDVELWRIQSASKRKGANDAVKRAAANKERDRVRALKRQEEKAKAEAKAAAEAEEKARKEAEEKAAAEAEEKAALAAAASEEKKKAVAFAKEEKKKNGGAATAAAVNGDATAAATGEKKKRKRKKKKGGAAVEGSRAPLVKPAVSPPERWEVVPQVEEWQEVNTKRTKNKAKMESAVTATAASPDDAAFLSEEPVVEEPGEISITMAAGDDPLVFIGKGGSTIQNLQETSGAKFHLNRQTNVLTISGSEDAVQLGQAAAQSILDAEAERKANEAEERVTWGSDAIKAVIGRGGANIRATQEATGVRIDADVEAGTLVIVGSTDQVAAALTMCHNAAFGEVQEVLELGSRNAVNLVYGPNFETIRGLQDATGCKLDITRGSTTLKLAGSSDAVAEATAQIRALLEANRGFEMTIENSKVGAVYGKGGETLRSIQDRTGTQIEVSRGPTHATVSVMGTSEASSRARNMLQRAIDGEVELQPGEVAEEIELGNATAAVIGRGGSNVASLEKTHGVKINVRSELQKARIVGKPDKVEAAAKAINAIAKPILDAEEAQKKADAAIETGESAWAQVGDTGDDADGW